MLDYTFTEQDAIAAHEGWGANCGPFSLAFILQVGIEAVRGKIPEFESKRYTSPTASKGRCSMSEIRAWSREHAILAAAADDHPADDGEAITEEWLLKEGFKNECVWRDCKRFHVLADDVVIEARACAGPKCWEWSFATRNVTFKRDPTRGDLRRLLAALGIQLS